MRCFILFMCISMLPTILGDHAVGAAGSWSEPVRLGPNVNGAFFNHFPFLTVDSDRLYLCARSGAQNEDIFVCKWDSIAKDWGPRQLLPATVNTGERELSPCESPDGRYLWFTRYNGLQGWDVYYSIRDSIAGTWTTAVNAGTNFNSQCHEWAVSISADGRRMFVTHDVRPGASGCEGHVLWISYWNDSLHWWDSLIWMGDYLNQSSFNNQACMSLDTAIIWISSGDSWPGSGKCGAPPDLAIVQNDPPDWDSVVSAGLPLNSCEEEGTVAISSDGNRLFFSSTRDTTSGRLEIYMSEWQPTVGVLDGLNKSDGTFHVSASPNPFNGNTTVVINSPALVRGSVTVFDVLGRYVMQLNNGFVPAGETRFSVDASTLPTGVYFVVVRAGDFSAHCKMLFLK